MSRRIKLVLSYDGTDFSGWQVQPEQRTVQGELEKALYKLHGERTSTIVAGRTDSGVHALGQVCHFDADSSIPGEKYREAINSLLPGDVRILSSLEVIRDFSARYSALMRSYKYLIQECTVPSPFSRKYALSLRELPPLRYLNECARQVIGVHDFTAFTAAGDPSKTKIREIFSSSFYMENGYLVYKIEGTAFLWKMIRSIIGTILETAPLSFPGERMKDILESGDRTMAGTTAPAKGLYFYKVRYDEQQG
ncbi:MAG: tRNA pseudouridine(38-40) synthase TruA [Spirochaetes bacterium]|nr:MAG: tRNA pseudouridine(38-40) synthase TruA [Spirochaetota bacterium]